MGSKEDPKGATEKQGGGGLVKLLSLGDVRTAA